MAKLYAEVAPDDFTYGDHYSLSTYSGKGTTPVYVIEQATYGDYAGYGTAGIANFRHLEKRYETSLADEDEPTLDIAFAFGSHGYHAVIYRTDQEPSEELAEILEQLEETSILDEDLHSEIEMNLVNAAVTDEWREFLKEIATPTLNGLLELPENALLDEDAIEERLASNADPAIQTFYSLLRHDDGSWAPIESSGTGSVSFDWTRMFSWIRRKMGHAEGLAEVNEIFAPLLELFGDTSPPEALQPLRFF